MMAQSHYLITGGAGFLGINLTRYLLAQGHKVTILDIAKFDYPDCKDRVRFIQGDVRNIQHVQSALEDVDIVVHGAAALPLYSEVDIMTTSVDGTGLILEQAFKLGIDRVIYISSTAVYGVPDHHPLVETDRLIGVGPYGIAKIKSEEICAQFRARGHIVPVIRPKSFIGPERLGVFAMLYDWAHSGKNFPMIGSGNNRYQLLDVEDLCSAISLTATLPADQANDVFNIGAKQFKTMKEDYQVVLDKAGFGKRIIGFPAAPVIMALRILEKLNLSPLYAWVYETAGKDSFVSIDKAIQKLGYSPKYSNQDALLRNFTWYLDNMQHFKPNDGGVSHRVPWSQGALRYAKWFF
jgi:nucleoside-diphosphate-sugar epimerase